MNITWEVRTIKLNRKKRINWNSKVLFQSIPVYCIAFLHVKTDALQNVRTKKLNLRSHDVHDIIQPASLSDLVSCTVILQKKVL